MRLALFVALTVLSLACVARAQDAGPRCAMSGSSIVCEGWDVPCPEGRFEVVLGEAVQVSAVRSGRACAVGGSGSLWCWSRADVADGCAAVTPREIVAVRGHAVQVELSSHATFVLSSDGTIGAWPEGSPRDVRSVPRAWADVQRLGSAEGPLRDVRSIEAGWSSFCAMTGPSEMGCWDGASSSPVATRVVLDHPVTRLECQDGCCALGPEGQASCWGDGASSVEALLADTPDRIDYLWNAAGACVATARRVECDGWMRPEVRPFVYWRGFELRGDERAIDLRFSEEGDVCLETTTGVRCWGETPTRLRGVRPIPSPTRRRLASGERVLRARVSALTCNEDGSIDAPGPAITAHVTPGRLRFDIHGLVSNCGYDPTIDVTLRADGTIILAPGDPPPDSPLARCECSFSLRVMVTGVPAGTHPVLFFADDDAPIASEVVAR